MIRGSFVTSSVMRLFQGLAKVSWGGALKGSVHTGVTNTGHIVLS